MNKKNTRFLLSTGTTFLVVFYFLSGVISTQASGGGISGWATTTSQVAGENILYSNNSTDILCLGGTATTTCPFYFDPNTNTSKLSGTLSAVIIPLQGTAASLVSVVPASGQTVYETDTKYVKVGDGTTAVGALNPTNLWTASANGYSSLKHVGIGTNPASSNGVALNVQRVI